MLIKLVLVKATAYNPLEQFWGDSKVPSFLLLSENPTGHQRGPKEFYLNVLDQSGTFLVAFFLSHQLFSFLYTSKLVLKIKRGNCCRSIWRMDRCCALIVFSCDAVSVRKELSVIRQKTWDGSDLLLPGRLTWNENWCTFRRHEKVQIRLVRFVPLPSTREQFLPVAAKKKRKEKVVRESCDLESYRWSLL